MKKISFFKDRLKIALLNSGMSQIELARRTGISRSLINKYLKGISEAGNDKLYVIAKTLHVSPTWLMGFDVDNKDVLNDEKKVLLEKINTICSNQDEPTLKTIFKIIQSIVE